MAASAVGWETIAAALVLAMQAGFIALHAGLTRPKNGVNIAVVRVAGTVTAALAMWVCGHGLLFGADAGGLVGSSGFFVLDGRSGLAPDGVAFFCLQVGFAATAAAIMSGAIAERVPFRAHVAMTVVLVAFIYPVFGHWVWGGGWLARLGFHDFAGASVVFSLGGWAALAMVVLVGNRSGSYTRRGAPVRIPGASIGLASIGAFVLWLGWLGWTSGHPSALASAPAGGAAPATIVLNTLMAGAAGGAVALAVSWVSDGVSDPVPAIHGVLAGLCAITASANAVDPRSALAIGAGGGAMMLVVTRLLEARRLDDAVGAIPVHLGGGLWGTLAVALFGDGSVLGDARSLPDQVFAQLIGAAACAAWGFGAVWLVGRALALVTPLRVRAEQERVGLNVGEHQTATELMDLRDAVGAARRAPVAEPFVATAVLAVGEGGAILGANPTTSAIFGYGEWELPSLPLARLFAREHDQLLAPAGLRAALGGSARELRGTRRSGEELPVELAVTAPEAGTSPPGAAFTVAITDLSARREHEAGLTRTQVECRQRFRRELDAVSARDGATLPAEHELPRARVAAALTGGDWFGYEHEPRTGSLVLYAGELLDESAGAAALLSGLAAGSDREIEHRHGLLLGDARYTPERQLQNLAEVLNRIVLQTGKGGLRMPVLLAHLDLPTGTLTWLDAGGTAPMWVRTDKTVRQVGGEGDMLGTSGDRQWATRTLDLAPGDLVCVCPPGLVGSFGPDGRVLTAREVRRIIASQPEPSGVRDQLVSRGGDVWRDRGAGVVGAVVVRIV